MQINNFLSILLLISWSSIILLSLGRVTQAKKSTISSRDKDKSCQGCEAVLRGVRQLFQDNAALHNHVSSEEFLLEQTIGEYCSQVFIPPAERKVCYFLVPLQRTVATYLQMKMPNSKICNKLAKSNPDFCEKIKSSSSKYLEGSLEGLEASNTMRKKRAAILE
mmetsp:Transcript_4723/g.8377  ORF Transcript_4723/g.8377 Transcript_4723/m.8377 type:complete len:164 (-) Transcript_4723:330-821(-)